MPFQLVSQVLVFGPQLLDFTVFASFMYLKIEELRIGLLSRLPPPQYVSAFVFVSFGIEVHGIVIDSFSGYTVEILNCFLVLLAILRVGLHRGTRARKNPSLTYKLAQNLPTPTRRTSLLGVVLQSFQGVEDGIEVEGIVENVASPTRTFETGDCTSLLCITKPIQLQSCIIVLCIFRERILCSPTESDPGSLLIFIN